MKLLFFYIKNLIFLYNNKDLIHNFTFTNASAITIFCFTWKTFT